MLQFLSVLSYPAVGVDLSAWLGFEGTDKVLEGLRRTPTIALDDYGLSIYFVRNGNLYRWTDDKITLWREGVRSVALNDYVMFLIDRRCRAWHLHLATGKAYPITPPYCAYYIDTRPIWGSIAIQTTFGTYRCNWGNDQVPAGTKIPTGDLKQPLNIEWYGRVDHIAVHSNGVVFADGDKVYSMLKGVYHLLATIKDIVALGARPGSVAVLTSDELHIISSSTCSLVIPL